LFFDTADLQTLNIATQNDKEEHRFFANREIISTLSLS